MGSRESTEIERQRERERGAWFEIEREEREHGKRGREGRVSDIGGVLYGRAREKLTDRPVGQRGR